MHCEFRMRLDFASFMILTLQFQILQCPVSAGFERWLQGWAFGSHAGLTHHRRKLADEAPEVNERFEVTYEDKCTEIWELEGDIRIKANTNVAVLYTTEESSIRLNSTRPYPRKWDKHVMQNKVGEVFMVSKKAPQNFKPWHLDRSKRKEHWISRRLPPTETCASVLDKMKKDKQKRFLSTEKYFVTREELEQNLSSIDVPKCDVKHRIPGLIFSSIGYSGNFFHSFNDVLFPLYVTTQHYNGELVMILADFEEWWIYKFQHLLRQLSNYPLVLLGHEKLSHCFKKLSLGLRFHGNLIINSSSFDSLPQKGSYRKFQALMEKAWSPKPATAVKLQQAKSCKARLLFLERKKSRSITNFDEVAKMAQGIGFEIVRYSPKVHTNMSQVWTAFQESDVVLGVHGAALTQYVFMKPNKTLIQIVPFGLIRVDYEYFGFPSIEFGLRYVGYKAQFNESSLRFQYSASDEVVTSPRKIYNWGAGWLLVHKYYLSQNVTVDIGRFRKVLQKVFDDMGFKKSSCNG